MRPPTRPALPSRWPAIAASAAILATLLSGAAGADVVHLKNGQRLQGDVTEQDGQVTIRSAGGTLGVPATIVERIERAPSFERQADERLRSLLPDDVDGRYELARDLEDAGATTLARRVIAEVLARDPDHAGARAVLGQVPCDGHWATEEECHRSRGQVLYQGRWMSPDEAATLALIERQRERLELVRLRASIEVEAARLEAARRVAATGGGPARDGFGYPYDSFGYSPALDGIPLWYGYPVVAVPYRHGPPDARPALPAPAAVPRAAGAATAGGLHHAGGTRPSPLAPRSNGGSRTGAASAPVHATAGGSRR